MDSILWRLWDSPRRPALAHVAPATLVAEIAVAPCRWRGASRTAESSRCAGEAGPLLVAPGAATPWGGMKRPGTAIRCSHE